MVKKSTAKFLSHLEYPGQSLETRMEIPEDLHWMDLKKYPYFGEIYSVSQGKYYSRQAGRRYRPKVEKEHKHLDEGHFQGFSFGIEHFSEPGDWILDPFVGSGTALIEAYLQDRNSIGIELEFSSLLDKNLEYLKANHHTLDECETLVYHGDARKKIKEITQELSLIITGFPYPMIGGITADAPFTETAIPTDKDFVKPVGYLKEESLGCLKWGPKFLNEMDDILSSAGNKLKVGGRIITIIKDCIHKKEPFFLQEMVTQYFLDMNPNFEIEGWYLHKHTPQTFFQNNHLKKYPERPIPLYQIGLILKKLS